MSNDDDRTMEAYQRGRRDERKRLGTIAVLRYDPDQELPAKLGFLDGKTLRITFGPNDQVASGVALFHTMRTEVIFDRGRAEEPS